MSSHTAYRLHTRATPLHCTHHIHHTHTYTHTRVRCVLPLPSIKARLSVSSHTAYRLHTRATPLHSTHHIHHTRVLCVVPLISTNARNYAFFQALRLQAQATAGGVHNAVSTSPVPRSHISEHLPNPPPLHTTPPPPPPPPRTAAQVRGCAADSSFVSYVGK